jgi:hypothetical protein
MPNINNPPNIPAFPSLTWYSDICTLALNFLGYLTKKKKAQFIKIDIDRFHNIFRYYYITMTDFKQRVYGKDALDNRIDKHKILAIYIKSILVNKPFFIDSSIKNGFARIELLANEFFCMSLIETVLKSWDKYNINRVLHIPRHERSWLVILFHQYYRFPDTLDIISLSHIIYYLEKDFFKLP